MVLDIPLNSTTYPRQTLSLSVAEGGKYTFVVTDESQSWFWSESWQQGEALVDDYILRGEFEAFDSMDEFLESLGLNE